MSVMKQGDKDGFRRVLTRAPYAEKLIASPDAYDAAPMYLVDEYRKNSKDVQREVARNLESELAEEVEDNTAAAKARLIMEVGAPAAFGVVRTVAVAGMLGKFVLMANPAVALVSGTALFFSGRETLADLRRSLLVDPKVRSAIKQAQSLSSRGNFRQAEACLKEALELDIDPKYGRNGDLWMQLGLVQMQDSRVREAMVSLAKASVLFGRKDEIVINSRYGEVKVSKRGLAEMLACAAIDSFTTSCDSGLDEWESIVSDFADSAVKRLESVADRRERGQLFGVFGVEAESAAYGRELSAKVQFLAAKMQLKRAAGSDTEGVDSLIRDAMADLKAAALTPEELCTAILEQAHFYADRIMSGQDVSQKSIYRALELFEEAANAIETTGGMVAARIRAESAKFAIEVIPRAVAVGEDVGRIRQQVLKLLERLQPSLSASDRSQEFPALASAWAEEQKVGLYESTELRYGAAAKAHDLFLQTGEPVSAIQNALRMAYFSENDEQKLGAIKKLVDATKRILQSESNPVTRAYAAKYFLDAGQYGGGSLNEWTRNRSGELFLEAARFVRENRAVVPFNLNGRALVHPWQVAEVILMGQAAKEFATAGISNRALTLHEKVSLVSEGNVDPVAKAAMTIERAELLIDSDRGAAAKELLDDTLDQARQRKWPAIQSRALTLKHAIEDAEHDSLFAESDPDAADPENEVDGTHGELMGRFAFHRQKLFEAGTRTLDIATETGLLSGNTQLAELQERLEGRLERLQRGLFRIGVVGEFSAGKSTFLNALFGERLLPSSIRPTTATAVRVRWAEEPSVQILFEDGSEKSIDFAELSKFVTERQNRNNEKGVSEVKIGYPINLLKNGVELIDTPGVSSLVESHTEITYQTIPSCDAVVLLATGRQPFSESIREFFDHLRLVVDGKVFYVLNKIDQLSDEGKEQALEFAEKRVADYVEGAEVIPLSAYQAMMGRMMDNGAISAEEMTDDPRLADMDSLDNIVETSYLPQLEKLLESFLERERGRPLIKSVAGAFIRAQTEMTRLIDVELEAAQMDREEKRKAHRDLKRQNTKRRAAVEEELDELERELRTAVDEILQRPTRELPKLTEEIVRRTNVSHHDLIDEHSAAGLQERVQQITRAYVDECAKNLTNDLSKKLGWYEMRARRQLREMQKELQMELTSRLDLGDAEVSMDVALDTPIEFGDHEHSLDDSLALVGHTVLGGALGLIGVILLGPLGIGLAMIGSFFGSSAIEDVKRDRQVAKVNNQLRRKIRESLMAIADELINYFEKESQVFVDRGVESINDMKSEIYGEFDAQLDLIIEDAEGDIQERQVRISNLRDTRSKLVELRESLKSVVSGWG